MSEDLSRSFAGQAAVAANEIMQGVAMKRLTSQRKSSRIEYKHSGRDLPSTVINFNPVRLQVCDGNVPWAVPSCIDKEKKSITVPFGGKKYTASYFTVREPRFVPWLTDVKKPTADDENTISEYKPIWLQPIELLNQYKLEYTDPSKNMTGGVIVIEGDIHSFTKSKGTIRIPKYEKLEDGRLTYFSEEVDLEREVAATLELQKTRCTFMIQQGDEYNQDDQQRKNITPVHRIWAQFAIDMGWKQVAPPWMSAVLDSEETCKGCGKGRARSDAWACACGRFYNPLAAFLAGENVPEAYIYALSDSKDIAQAEAEMKRRMAAKARFESLSGKA